MKIKSTILICSILCSFCCLTLNASDWYSTNKEYYKIATTFDGIAKIEMNEILKINPDLEGKQNSFLHLIYEGKEYPYFYYYNNENTNNLINQNDVIYFLGKQAKGDSTYYDNYTNEAVFYLCYDEINYSDRLTKFNEPNETTAEINSVTLELHIEKDSAYFDGYNALNPMRDRFEGWYWKLLRDFPRNTTNIENARLTINTILFPVQNSNNGSNDDNSNDSVEITAHFSTIYNNTSIPNPRTKYKVYTILNTDTINISKFDSLVENYTASAKIAATNFFAGANSLQVVNASDDTINIRIGVDYFTLKGKSKPFAFKSNSVFPLDKVTSNSYIQVNGFSDSIIFVYDEISKSLIEKKGTPNIEIAVNAKSNLNPDNALQYATLKIHDDFFTSRNAGLHIAYLPQNSNKAEFISDTSSGTNIEANIQAIQTQTIVAVAFNGKYELTNFVKNWLKQNGCKEVDNIATGSAYTCVFTIGNNNASEKHNEIKQLEANTSSSVANLFDEEKRAYSLKFNVAGNNEKPIDYSFNIISRNAVENAAVSKVKQTDYKNKAHSAEMIIITYKDFYEKSKEYAEYRQQKGIKVFVADVEEIYKEFSFGKKTPYAIKDFLKFAYENWEDSNLRYALLVGETSIDPKKNNPDAIAIDYVPCYGYPVTDYWYGLLYDEPNKYSSEILVGRIPANSNEDVENYLEKVKIYENTDVANWHKLFYFINGGANPTENNSTANAARRLVTMLTTSPICADSLMTNRTIFTGEATTTAYKNEIINTINNGTLFTIFDGHGSPMVFDMDGWEVENLNNKNKMGILITNSCNTGAFAEPGSSNPATNSSICRNESYILHKDKGFVLALGSTTVSTAGTNNTFMTWFFHQLVAWKIRRVSEMLESTRKIINYDDYIPHDNDKYFKLLRYCFSMLGDPTIAVRIDTLPDFYINENDISITNQNNETFIKADDKMAYINFPIYNAGICPTKSFSVKLTHTYKNSENNNFTKEYFFEHNETYEYFCCSTQKAFFEIDIAGKEGEHYIEITLDDKNEIAENNKSNNVASKSFYVYKDGLFALEPLPFWNMKSNSILFRQINPLKPTNSFDYRFTISEIQVNKISDNEISVDTLIIKHSADDEVKIYENYIDWTPDILLKENAGNYLLSSQTINLTTQDSSGILNIPFNTYHLVNDEEAVWSLNTSEEVANFSFENMQQILTFTGTGTENISQIEIVANTSAGQAVSPFIGPAKKWNYLSVKGNFADNNADNQYKSKILVTGFDINKNFVKVLNEFEILNELNTLGTFDISGFAADSFPYINITFVSNLNNNFVTSTKHFLSGVECAFSPAPEIACKAATSNNSNNNYTHFRRNSVLRGDSIFLEIWLENISLRANTLPMNSSFEIIDFHSGATQMTAIIDIPDIPSNRNYNNIFKFENDDLAKNNTAIVKLNTSNIGNELYLFNNNWSSDLEIYEDTIKPRMEVSFDGEIIVNSDFISDEPNILVRVTDNSALPVTARMPIEARLNGIPLTENNTQFYELQTFPKGNGLKSSLNIISPKLIDNENLFTFICVDGSGNRDTAEYFLFISLNIVINNLGNYPNPVFATDDDLTFDFYLTSITSGAYAEVEIYNSLGAKVATVRQPAKIGRNFILWNLRDAAGKLVNPGIYFYKLDIYSDYWTEPKFGKFVFNK